MERLMQQMKKGCLELVVLATIAEKPAYGYELLRLLDARSEGLFKLKEGTLYPILYRLEDDDLITAQWQQEGRANPKKYYAVTPQGQQRLPQLRASWHSFSACVEQMLSPQNPAKRRGTGS